jgi:hypothetical protein
VAPVAPAAAPAVAPAAGPLLRLLWLRVKRLDGPEEQLVARADELRVHLGGVDGRRDHERMAQLALCHLQRREHCLRRRPAPARPVIDGRQLVVPRDWLMSADAKKALKGRDAVDKLELVDVCVVVRGIVAATGQQFAAISTRRAVGSFWR